MIALSAWVWGFFSFFVWVVFIIGTASLAGSKGRNGWLWGLLAVFLPIIAFVIVLVLPRRTIA
jgi:hypothetical protein